MYSTWRSVASAGYWDFNLLDREGFSACCKKGFVECVEEGVLELLIDG